MKQGEPPPKGVKELVLKLAARDPRPTNKQIREGVQTTFGEGTELSDRTIGRYCKAAGLPGSSRGSPTPNEREAAARVALWQEARALCREGNHEWLGDRQFEGVAYESTPQLPYEIDYFGSVNPTFFKLKCRFCDYWVIAF